MRPIPNPNPNLVLYACIAKGTAILAEFSRDPPGIPSLALKCIEHPPPNHSMFSQTCRHRTYTFLIDDPFVYFGIFDDALSKTEGLHFLGKVKAEFLELVRNGAVKNSSDLGPSNGLQTLFDAIVRGLIQSGSDSESVYSPRSEKEKLFGMDSASRGRNFTAMVMGSPGQGLKKKRRFNGEVFNGSGNEGMIIIKDINLENKVDLSNEMNGLGPKNISYPTSDRQKAKQVWKKQVCLVLLLDLFVCAILFGVWLWVCRGFQCIND